MHHKIFYLLKDRTSHNTPINRHCLCHKSCTVIYI